MHSEVIISRLVGPCSEKHDEILDMMILDHTQITSYRCAQRQQPVVA